MSTSAIIATSSATSTTRQVGRFNGYDELYWNATGNGWIFPIDVAEARIRLPEPVKFGQRAIYTGRTGRDVVQRAGHRREAGRDHFPDDGPLGPDEGLTVAVAFPKGVVAEPNRAASYWLADYGPLFVGAGGLLGLLGYYFFAWKRAGRDPRAGTVVPIFSPPDDLTPGGHALRRPRWARTTAPSLPRSSTWAFAATSAWSRKTAAGSRSDKTRLERIASDRAPPRG